jgi:hypothetical protein
VDGLHHLTCVGTCLRSYGLIWRLERRSEVSTDSGGPRQAATLSADPDRLLKLVYVRRVNPHGQGWGYPKVGFGTSTGPLRILVGLNLRTESGDGRSSRQLAGGRASSSLLPIDTTASIDSGPTSPIFEMIAFGQAIVTPSIS